MKIDHLVVGVLVVLFTNFQTVKAEPSIEQVIQSRLTVGVATPLRLHAHGYTPKEIDEALLHWYEDRSFQPIWIENGAPSVNAGEVLKVIDGSIDDGLEPEDYFISLIEARWKLRDSQHLAELELLLSLGAVRLAADARDGRLLPREIDIKGFEGAKLEKPDLGGAVKTVLYSSDVAKAIREQFPCHRQYGRMKEALKQYREIALKGGWNSVTAGPPFKPEDHGLRVIELAKRLEITGDLSPKGIVVERYAGALEQAVKRFQKRHGLPETGAVHQKTLEALNVPVEARIETILINLERWRWLMHDFSDKEVLVNIAGFELFALNDSEISLRPPVIVGKAFHASPIFSEPISYIEFNPYWNVPPSIAANEILPKLKRNPRYLAQQHMELFERSTMNPLSPLSINWSGVSPAAMNRYFVRQEPGSWNALGTLKFVFPNKYSVYLHDTASRGLFSQNDRALSHGCIRVSSPSTLAAFLLDTPEERWDIARVNKVLESGKNQNIKLPKKIPLHLTYRTAWVDVDQNINFRPDIYLRDRKVALALA